MHVVICKDPIMEYAGGESCKGGPEESVNSLSILNSPSYRLDGTSSLQRADNPFPTACLQTLHVSSSTCTTPYHMI